MRDSSAREYSTRAGNNLKAKGEYWYDKGYILATVGGSLCFVLQFSRGAVYKAFEAGWGEAPTKIASEERRSLFIQCEDVSKLVTGSTAILCS